MKNKLFYMLIFFAISTPIISTESTTNLEKWEQVSALKCGPPDGTCTTIDF